MSDARLACFGDFGAASLGLRTTVKAAARLAELNPDHKVPPARVLAPQRGRSLRAAGGLDCKATWIDRENKEMPIGLNDILIM